jgi:hypothetical protein
MGRARGRKRRRYSATNNYWATHNRVGTLAKHHTHRWSRYICLQFTQLRIMVPVICAEGSGPQHTNRTPSHVRGAWQESHMVQPPTELLRPTHMDTHLLPTAAPAPVLVAGGAPDVVAAPLQLDVHAAVGAGLARAPDYPYGGDVGGVTPDAGVVHLARLPRMRTTETIHARHTSMPQLYKGHARKQGCPCPAPNRPTHTPP